MGETRKNPGDRSALGDVAIEFARLGLTSFGGPVAHIAYFREACVVRRGWMSEKGFADVVALCQFLPGPASSQAAFALGMCRAGWKGAIVASVLFLWPSAAIMIAMAYAAAGMPGMLESAWVHGLKVATVGIVLHAVWSMARTLCPDTARLAIAGLVAAGCAAGGSVGAGAMTNVAGIALGLLIGWVMLSKRLGVVARAGRDEAEGAAPIATRAAMSRRTGAGLLVACAVLLGLSVAASAGAGANRGANDTVAQVAAMYRSGSLVFGGGHVVLPLLRDQTVTRGWIDDEAFLMGYAGAQTVPGPLFSFAAYLGAAMEPAGNGGGAGAGNAMPRWLNGVVCVVAIFVPGWLLVAGAMPFWERLRRMPRAVGALGGANAAVVGVLVAAWADPVASTAIRAGWGPGLMDVGMAAGAFVALAMMRAPAWGVVLVCAAGAWAMGMK